MDNVDWFLQIMLSKFKNIFSASSLVSAVTWILLLFSFSFTLPMKVGTSFPMSVFESLIGRAICMILFASSGATGNSGLSRSFIRITFVNSPPKTDL